MRVSRLLLHFSVAAVANAMPAVAEPTSPTTTPTQIVRLYVGADRALAMLTIGESPPLPVVFDTGTDENIVDSAYAAKAGLQIVGHSPLTDGATNKTIEVPVAATPESHLGGVALDTKTVQLLDYRPGDEIGIFGPYSFGDRYVIVEAGLNRLRIVPKDSGFVPPGAGHAYKDNLPAVEITVGGQQREATIDTGNDSVLTLGGDLLKTTPLTSPAAIVGRAKSALGDREIMGGELAGALVVGSYEVPNPDVSFSLSGSGANIGFEVIRHLTIVLDPASKRSWVLDPGGEHPIWKDFTGRFGPRSIRLEKGKLIHQREGRPPFKLTYLGGDLFEMPATGDRLQFFRKEGRVVRLELITADGQIAAADRTF